MNAREEMPITEEVMRYAKAHMESDRPWSHGRVARAYREHDGRISITYEDSCWWSGNEKERLIKLPNFKRSREYLPLL